VPRDVDDCSASAPFIGLILSILGPALHLEPAVAEYVGRNPGFREQVRTLSAAGVRVRDAGLLTDEVGKNNLTVYTPEEIWTFDLVVDVIAVLGALHGLRGKTRAQVAEDLRLLDRTAHSHTWKKELKRAGEGVPQFRELRARIPQHTPHPAV